MDKWLTEKGVTPELRSVIIAIATATAGVRTLLARSSVKSSGKSNEFDDDQLNVDLSTDKLIAETLSRCPNVGAWASEEAPAITLSRPDAKSPHFVAYDPLDGSSIIDTNFAVGSIFGIWPGLTPVGKKVGSIVASVVACYGPRCELFVAISGSVAKFTFIPDIQTWILGKEIQPLAARAKFFSPGNLRATTELPWYKSVIEDYMQRKVTLRYTGGMVPDIMQMLIKGSGIFMTPSSPSFKMKLRVCFECGPIAFMIEQAGGRTTDSDGRSYLERIVETTNDRSGIILGSKDDVASVVSMSQTVSKL